MNESEFQRLIEAAIQGRLMARDEARLQDHLEKDPVAKRLWQEELALTRLLKKLPDAPLASNFTAQVLLAVDHAEQREHRHRSSGILKWITGRRPVLRLGWACAVIAAAGLGYHQYHVVGRARMAASLASIASGVETASNATQLPPAELWQDFEPIYRLGNRSGADEELLAALR